MENKNLRISNEEIQALDKIIGLVKDFIDKNPIIQIKFNFNRIKEKIVNLKNEVNTERYHKFKKLLKRIESIVWKEIRPKIYHIFGGHGGVIINDIGFCEFDSPKFALDRLIDRMK
ncbi:MAG: hypothetical protein ACFFHV_17485, partial [Promethearchaeota archaeon]